MIYVHKGFLGQKCFRNRPIGSETAAFLWLMDAVFTRRLFVIYLQTLCPALCTAIHFLLALHNDTRNNHSSINLNGSGRAACHPAVITVIHTAGKLPLSLPD